MAITANQQAAASGSASDAALRGAPTSPDNVRNILLAYISENLNPLASLTGPGLVYINNGTSSVAVEGTDYSGPASTFSARYTSVR